MPRTAPVVTGAAHLGHEANGGDPKSKIKLYRAPMRCSSITGKP
jgi:hypothetical protein